MIVSSVIVPKVVEVVKTEIVNETVVVLELGEREAKLLGCLIGAMSPTEAEDIIRDRSLNFDNWVGELKPREIVELTGNIYDNIYNIFVYDSDSDEYEG